MTRDAAGAGSAFWEGRRVLVTGATGLLGSWTVRHLLDAGAVVVCLVRSALPAALQPERAHTSKRIIEVRGALNDARLLERTLAEHGVRTVFHLAAQALANVAMENPVLTFETNIAGTWRLLEACRSVGIVEQIVVASSDKAYGSHEQLPYVEEAPLRGLAPYDVSKACAAILANCYAASFAAPICWTMCGNFFGPGDYNWNRIVPHTIRSVLEGRAPVIRSDGHFVRDYFYVKDGAAAYCTLAEQMAARPELVGQGFNFSHERPKTVLEIVDCILKLMGRSDLRPTVLNQANSEIRKQYLSSEKAHRLLGWYPTWDLEEALMETIAWYRLVLQ